MAKAAQKVRAKRATRKPESTTHTLARALARAKTAGDYYAVYREAAAHVETICCVIDPNNDHPEPTRLANVVLDQAIWGLVKTRAAYRSEVREKLEAYRDLLLQGSWNDNREHMLLQSAIVDLTGSNMDDERHHQVNVTPVKAVAVG
jgi:hypothetical protein